MQGAQCICITGVTPWRKRGPLSQRNKTILRILFRCDHVYRFQKTTPLTEWYFAAASSEQHLLMSSKPSLSLRHSHQQDTPIAPPSHWKLRLEICTEGFCRRKQPKLVESGALYARTIENVISSRRASKTINSHRRRPDGRDEVRQNCRHIFYRRWHDGKDV